jgi:hypothetical protein
MPTAQLRPGHLERTVNIDLWTGAVVCLVKRDDGLIRLEPIGTTIDLDKSMRYSIVNDDPLSARSEVYYRYGVERDDWSTAVVGRTVLTAARDSFHLDIAFEAFERGERVFDRTWSQDIPRDLV